MWRKLPVLLRSPLPSIRQGGSHEREFHPASRFETKRSFLAAIQNKGSLENQFGNFSGDLADCIHGTRRRNRSALQRTESRIDQRDFPDETPVDLPVYHGNVAG